MNAFVKQVNEKFIQVLQREAESNLFGFQIKDMLSLNNVKTTKNFKMTQEIKLQSCNTFPNHNIYIIYKFIEVLFL